MTGVEEAPSALSCPDFPHHFSHHLGVTGWTSRLRLGVCVRLVRTARYGQLRSQSTCQGGRRGFEPLLPLKKNGHLPRNRGVAVFGFRRAGLSSQISPLEAVRLVCLDWWGRISKERG